MKFISHLDLMRLFQRAMRRSGVPIYLTKGFNPHPKLSFKRALKLGAESENEEAQFYLEPAGIAPDEFKERLNKELPEGIKIIHAETDIN
ncbi:MAG: TIGR03936 family radical SAM-associated protein [Candidatus Omnitrophica bacterium]|nr:TIGR03936 family radical SAM-associated protein [Candidatus Omnitrophota bacterium]